MKLKIDKSKSCLLWPASWTETHSTDLVPPTRKDKSYFQLYNARIQLTQVAEWKPLLSPFRFKTGLCVAEYHWEFSKSTGERKFCYNAGFNYVKCTSDHRDSFFRQLRMPSIRLHNKSLVVRRPIYTKRNERQTTTGGTRGIVWILFSLTIFGYLVLSAIVKWRSSCLAKSACWLNETAVKCTRKNAHAKRETLHCSICKFVRFLLPP